MLPGMSTLILLMIIGFIHGGQRPLLNHMKVPVPYSAAESFCSALSVPSQLVDDSIDHEELRIYMRSNNLSSVWLGIKRQYMLDWTWVDGNKLTLEMPGGENIATGACGGISTVTGTLRAMGCNYGGDYEGVVCEHEGSCNHNLSQDQSFCVEGKPYSFHCRVRNWYDARDSCNSKKAMLAKLDTQEKINALQEAKSKVASMFLCGFFWIGLRKEDWYKGEADGVYAISLSHWDRGEPKDSVKCAAASFRDYELVWTAEDCERKHAAVCMQSDLRHRVMVNGTSKYRMTTLNKSDYVTDISTTKPEHVLRSEDISVLIPILGVIGSIFATSLIISIVIICLKRRSKSLPIINSHLFENKHVGNPQQYESVPMEESSDTKREIPERINEYLHGNKEEDNNKESTCKNQIKVEFSDNSSVETEFPRSKDLKHPLQQHLVQHEKTEKKESGNSLQQVDRYQEGNSSIENGQNVQNDSQIKLEVCDRNTNRKHAPGKGKSFEMAPVFKPDTEDSWDIFSKKTLGEAPAFKITMLCENDPSLHIGNIFGNEDNYSKRGFNDQFLQVFRTLLGVDENLHPPKGSLEKIRAMFISSKSQDPYTEEIEKRLLGLKPHIIVDMTSKTNQQADSWYEKKKDTSVIIKHDKSKNELLFQNMLIPHHYFKLSSAYEDKEMGFSSDVSTWTVVVICTLVLWSAKAGGLQKEKELRNTDNMRRILDRLKSLSCGSIHPHILWEHLLN